MLLVALLIEAATGYPDPVFRRIGHPVTWIGRLIDGLDHRLNRADLDSITRRRHGVLALVLIVLVPAGAAWAVESALLAWLGVWALVPLAVLASTLIAQRSLHVHVHRVARALEHSLDEGRTTVAQIVGRDPQMLDEAGVARAAVESLAESFSDGVVAPAFYLFVGSLPGAVAYKALNTADSMIGHRSPRFEAFGWASARLDDWVNLPASRLSALLLIAAAALVPGCDARAAIRSVRRDAKLHRSPNAGWPEAAMAGALGLRIAGPRSYGGVPYHGPWMGEGRETLTPADILAALRLYKVACAVLAGLASVCAAALLV
jgi:adenosylcobinamide-phosphate synthase